MFTSMVYYKRDTSVRWPALKDMEVTPTDTHAPVLLVSPGSLAACTGCARDKWDSALKCLQNPETHWRRPHHKTSCVVGPSLLDVTNL